MAARFQTARFEKDGMKILDGFDQLSPYQMVPKGSERPMSVVTGYNHCKLVVRDSSIVGITHGAIRGPFASWELLPNTPYDFSILSIGNTGKTRLELRERFSDDQPYDALVGTLFVSVKVKVLESFALLFLQDNATPKNHATQRNRAQADHMMGLVTDTYLAQANVKLTPTGTAPPVIVPHDLGNPLIIDKNMPILPGQLAGAQGTLHDAIFAATPTAFRGSALIRVYCCWDVGVVGKKPKNTLGATIHDSTSCFVEDGTNEFVFAHEIGHALGLSIEVHNPRPKRLMFESRSPPR